MTIHTVIESLSAYEAVRAADPEGPRVWWTTSPYLLVRLPRMRETVRSPEDGLPQQDFDRLAKAARDVGDEFCAWYQDACTWKGYTRFHFVLALQVTRCIFVGCYKALLLSRIVASAQGSKVVCVGRAGDPEQLEFAMTYGRVDTLFAALVPHGAPGGPELFAHETPATAIAAIEHRVRQRPMGRLEKVLSLLNNTPGSWVFKTWKNLRRRGLFPTSRLSLSPFGGRTYWVHKECELLQEAALGILRRGGRIAQLPALPRPQAAAGETLDSPECALISEKIRGLVRQAADRHALQWTPLLDGGVELAIRRCIRFLGRLRNNFDDLNKGFSMVVAGTNPGDEILTSALASPIEGLFYGFCRERRITVTAFDHGVTLGLSEWSISEARQTGMLAADRGFYHCPRAVAATRPHAPWQLAQAVGLPQVTLRPALRPLQRVLGRRLLGLLPGEHVVMHVPDLERNNFIYGPYQDNDWQFLCKTREATELLCRSFPRSRVVLKLYPTQRYLDAYDFSDLAERHPNLLIVGDVDFRFLRSSADLLFTASTQSTIGWVAGSGSAYAYLDYQWSPGRIEGLRLECSELSGLAALVLPDPGSVCLAHPADVANVLFARSAC